MSTPVIAPRTIHLMRHGEPVRTGCMLGRTDVDVTPQGIDACAAQAADLTATTIVSSDLIRAGRCAAGIADGRGLSVIVDPRWREYDFGDWDGRGTDAIDPDALARFWRDPDGRPPPGGERWSALTARAGEALATCGDATLVVTHAGAIRGALAAACDLSFAQTWAFDLPYAALITLRYWPGAPPTAQIVRLRP